MGIDDQAVKILMDFLSRIDTRIGLLDEKLSSKLENGLQSTREEMLEIHDYQTRLDARCEARRAQTEGFCNRMGQLEKDVGTLKLDVRDLKQAEERDEWKIFWKMCGKLALFVTTIGSAVLLLYQIYTTMFVRDSPQSAPAIQVSPTPP